jgi:probable rRNA maturation factor
VDVRNAQRKVRVDVRLLQRCSKVALLASGARDAEVSVVVVSDRRIHELNLRYRGLDRPTDVLSFSQQEDAAACQCAGLLGDVVLSAETALRQGAERHGRHRDPLHRELAILLVHGIAHLMGHDHRDESSRRKMRAVERRMLAEIDRAFTSA